jgi:hypothetical protein
VFIFLRVCRELYGNMTSHAIPFAIIAAFFRDNNQQLQRGEIGYRDGHVLKMTYDGTVQPALVKGVVQASMKKKSYEVEVFLFNNYRKVGIQCFFFNFDRFPLTLMMALHRPSALALEVQ